MDIVKALAVSAIILPLLALVLPKNDISKELEKRGIIYVLHGNP